MTRAELKQKCEALAPYGDACAKATLEALEEIRYTRELLDRAYDAEPELELAEHKIKVLEDEIDRLTRAAAKPEPAPLLS